MSKTRNLSDLLDANGDVKTDALDNVPASDVVNDTTPQLGGNLDLNSNNITGTGNVNITGNITLTGNVDGRDVSADGTKLDGIESGATADMSASEILTAIKTVDGAGSGLDADTLDGVSSGSFLRSDTADSVGGTLSFGDNIKAQFGASNDLQIYHNGAASFIEDAGAGDLIIKAGDDLRLEDTGGDKYIVCNENTGVQVYYNGSEKLVTTSTGVNVTGALTVNGSSLGSGFSRYVNFNGTGTPSIRNSSGISSVTDEFAGGYTINFSTAVGNTNYLVLGTADRETGQRQCMVTIDQNNNGVNSGSCSIQTLNDGVTNRDAEIICVGILT